LVPTEVSLNTKELHEAKKIAADVTQASERLLPLLRDNMISAEDAKKILVKVALAHSAKLDAVAANEIAYGADVESSRRADIATGWAFRLLAAHGKNARIGEQEVREMRAAGLDDGIIVQTQQTITSLRAGGAFPPVEEKILDLLEAFDIYPANGNYQQAQQLYLRGLATALLDTRRQLERLFSSKTNTSPAAIYKMVRLERAKTLVTHTKAPLIEIAVEVGFESASHFARVFRKAYGQSPTTLRAELAAT
jgi:AraC-like DNA-binding protein